MAPLLRGHPDNKLSGLPEEGTVARKGKLRQNNVMIPWPVLLLYIYGILLIVGGAMGYVKAKSVPSLVAGGVSGVLALILAWYYDACPYVPVAALLLSLALTVVMGRRYLRTRTVMPALLIVVLSLVVAVAQIYVLFFSYLK